MKCELCSMEGTHRVVGDDGAVKFYCDHHAPDGAERINKSPSVLVIYKPLIIAGLVILITSLGISVWQGFDWLYFMQIFMGVFFLVFGGLKAVAWKDFPTSFANYDPLAKRVKLYGWLYPGIELFLAFLFLFSFWLTVASVITVVVLSLTAVGIISAIKRGETLQCVCLGSVISLPLGWVTVAENVLMIIMALVMLII